MAPIRSSPLSRPAPVSSTRAAGAESSLNPSAAALAKALDWHQHHSSPARVQEYHAAFLAALASDSLRADFSRALSQDYPATAQAVTGSGAPATGAGWGARAASDLPTDVAANWLAEALVRQRAGSPLEDVQQTYVAFRDALATDALKARLDRYLVSTNRDLARELGVI